MKQTTTSTSISQQQGDQAGGFSRRLFLGSCAATLATPALAQQWPSKPVRLVVAYGAGSPPDTFARIYGEFMSKELGAIIVVDNKAGASGNLGSGEVARAPGDGYTLLYNVSSAFSINPLLYTQVPFNTEKDLKPVGTTITQGFVVVANPSFPAKSFAEFLSLAKANPGKYTYGSWGVGSYSHLLMELALETAKAQMVHIPYRVSPLNEVVGGQIDVLIEPMASAYQFIASGRVKALAFTGDARHPALPAVPTISETIPGMTLRSWHGIWAPSSMPADLVTRLNAAMIKASKDPQISQKVRALQIDTMTASPADMSKLIAAEAATYAQLIKSKNIKLD